MTAMTEARKTAPTDTAALFVDYLNTVNTVLAQNRNDFPFDAIIGRANKILANKTIGVNVYQDEPARPLETFTIAMTQGKLYMIERGEMPPNLTWKVKKAYMQRVVDNQQQYLEHPTELDLEWLKSRIGVG